MCLFCCCWTCMPENVGKRESSYYRMTICCVSKNVLVAIIWLFMLRIAYDAVLIAFLIYMGLPYLVALPVATCSLVVLAIIAQKIKQRYLYTTFAIAMLIVIVADAGAFGYVVYSFISSNGLFYTDMDVKTWTKNMIFTIDERQYGSTDFIVVALGIVQMFSVLHDLIILLMVGRSREYVKRFPAGSKTVQPLEPGGAIFATGGRSAFQIGASDKDITMKIEYKQTQGGTAVVHETEEIPTPISAPTPATPVEERLVLPVAVPGQQRDSGRPTQPPPTLPVATISSAALGVLQERGESEEEATTATVELPNLDFNKRDFQNPFDSNKDDALGPLPEIAPISMDSIFPPAKTEVRRSTSSLEGLLAGPSTIEKTQPKEQKKSSPSPPPPYSERDSSSIADSAAKSGTTEGDLMASVFAVVETPVPLALQSGSEQRSEKRTPSPLVMSSTMEEETTQPAFNSPPPLSNSSLEPTVCFWSDGRASVRRRHDMSFSSDSDSDTAGTRPALSTPRSTPRVVHKEFTVENGSIVPLDSPPPVPSHGPPPLDERQQRKRNSTLSSSLDGLSSAAESDVDLADADTLEKAMEAMKAQIALVVKKPSTPSQADNRSERQRTASSGRLSIATVRSDFRVSSSQLPPASPQPSQLSTKRFSTSSCSDIDGHFLSVLKVATSTSLTPAVENPSGEKRMRRADSVSSTSSTSNASSFSSFTFKSAVPSRRTLDDLWSEEESSESQPVASTTHQSIA